MSNAEVNQVFYAWQIYGRASEPGCGDVSGCSYRAKQVSRAAGPIMGLSTGRYDLGSGVRPSAQPPRLPLSFEPLACPSFLFGSFRLVPSQRLLLNGGQPVTIGGRAMDLLTALVEQAGMILTKSELTKRVWPGLIVEEDNLKVQVSALRRALGDRQAGRRYILTVPGRGYGFVAQVTRKDEPVRGGVSEWLGSGHIGAVS